MYRAQWDGASDVTQEASSYVEMYSMGVERAVTRWYVRRQSILNEIADLEAQVAGLEARQPETDQAFNEEVTQIRTRLSQQLEEAHTKLRELGPCPRPMMG